MFFLFIVAVLFSLSPPCQKGCLRSFLTAPFRLLSQTENTRPTTTDLLEAIQENNPEKVKQICHYQDVLYLENKDNLCFVRQWLFNQAFEEGTDDGFIRNTVSFFCYKFGFDCGFLTSFESIIKTEMQINCMREFDFACLRFFSQRQPLLSAILRSQSCEIRAKSLLSFIHLYLRLIYIDCDPDANRAYLVYIIKCMLQEGHMVFNSELFCQLVKTQKLYWIKAYLEPLLHKSQIFFLHEEDRHSVECFTISFIQLITKATDCLMRGSAFFKEHKGLSLLEFSNKKMLIGEFIHCTQVASPEVLAYLVYKCQFTWAKMIVKNYNAVLNHEQKREFRIILETFLFQESSPYFLYQSDNCFFEVAECFLRVNSFFVPSRTVFQNSRKALCVCNNVSEFFLQKQDSFQRFINLSIFA